MLFRSEVIGQYLRKGRPVLVEGRLKLDQWDDKQTGQKRSRLGVVLEAFSFLDGGNREGGAAPAGAAPTARPARPAAAAPSPEGSGDEPPHGDDVPF